MRSWFHPYPVVVVFAVPPSSDPTSAKSQKHRTNEFPETGRIHRILSTLAAVLEVMGVEGGAWQGDPLRRLIVGDQPLDGGRADPCCIAQLVAWAELTASQAWTVWRLLSSHRSDQRGARSVRGGLDEERGAGIGDKLRLGGAQAIGR